MHDEILSRNTISLLLLEYTTLRLELFLEFFYIFFSFLSSLLFKDRIFFKILNIFKNLPSKYEKFKVKKYNRFLE